MQTVGSIAAAEGTRVNRKVLDNEAIDWEVRNEEVKVSAHTDPDGASEDAHKMQLQLHRNPDAYHQLTSDRGKAHSILTPTAQRTTPAHKTAAHVVYHVGALREPSAC